MNDTQNAAAKARERAVSKRWFIVLRSGGKVVYETSSWPLACTRLLEATEYDDRASLVTFHHVDGQWWLRSVLDVTTDQKFAKELDSAHRDTLMALVKT